ncbi:acetyl-CoA hydrolase/transferase C-terminal domain-containing protein [uncultured Nitratireductor sp.]|uniref:acetyl-CoA hydrolase/transferase C-terminal domain-containing protein n=1 Tax=uncultured Nitratireductor sp. TaxID=520953 RepID=UPI0025DC952F|nr:acetyl-CoA hydrolase/transferase C-terminal domain-containing protein [uncultured Nitratireductor sp.]
MRTNFHRDADDLARQIVEKAGGHIRLALPLGLGKANSIANALTLIARDDPSVELEILTALTLRRPRPASDLHRRFLDPASERLFGRYKPLLYAELLEQEKLPANIKIHEFFFQAGSWLDTPSAQQAYIAANYTHALDFIVDFRPHVIAQLVAADGSGHYSLSCNTDITADLLEMRQRGETDFLFACETNRHLPFMNGAALIGEDDIDLLLDDPADQFELFSVPRRPVSEAELAIGLHASRLVPDGGTLQIGIGSIGDAVAQALLLRDRDNGGYQELLNACPFAGEPPEDHRAPFHDGLYCATEMLAGGLLELFEADILRREVNGAAIHAGFFLECRDFYERLRSMPSPKRSRIQMTPVSFTNALYADEKAKRKARKDARFINNAMNATCLGEIASDRLGDGRVVSGVGGQFNFVTQAFELKGARSIIALGATRNESGRTVSNIVWEHPHATIPAHLRDIVITEYGIADLRGRSDEACIMAVIAVADSRFQGTLLDAAKAAGKVSRNCAIPNEQRENTPRRLKRWLHTARADGRLPAYPFGTDFTETEQRLLPALETLKKASGSRLELARLLLAGMRTRKPPEKHRACLERLSLAAPSGLHERATAWLVLGALSHTDDDTTHDRASS